MGSWGEICTFDTRIDTDGNVTHGAILHIDLSERWINEGRCHVSMWCFSPPVTLERAYAYHRDDDQEIEIVQGEMTRAELLKLRSDIDETLRQLDAREQDQEGAEHDD